MEENKKTAGEKIGELLVKYSGQLVASIQILLCFAAMYSALKPDKYTKKLRGAYIKEKAKQKKLESKLRMKEKKLNAKLKAKQKKLKLKQKAKKR